MAFVVQFQPEDWAHGFRVAEREINVLPVDPVGESANFAVVPRLCEEQICQPHFRTGLCPVAHLGPQYLTKAQFRPGQKIVPEPEWIGFGSRLRFVLSGEPVQDSFDDRDRVFLVN